MLPIGVLLIPVSFEDAVEEADWDRLFFEGAR
jgi:hypothetical protein